VSAAAKARWLAGVRGASEVAAMRRVKMAFEPAGVLNRGVVRTDPAADVGSPHSGRGDGAA
jgi:FAD/FMN-containing dehydrogenase